MICRTCNEDKPEAGFWKGYKGRPQTECKSCMRERNTAFCRSKREATSETSTARVREHRRKNPLRALIRGANCRARKAGLRGDLTLEQIGPPPRYCPVLGIELRDVMMGQMTRAGERFDNSPSLDKIKPELGYTAGNVVWMSWRANRIKNDATAEEVRKLAAYLTRLEEKQNEDRAGNLGGIRGRSRSDQDWEAIRDLPVLLAVS